MRNRDLKYSLTMDRDDFLDAQRLVMATLLTTKRKGPFNTLVHATEDYDELSDCDREFILGWDSNRDGRLEALCCWPGDGSYRFSVWINPEMNPLTDLYRISLLHELVHGYMNYSSHDASFRDMLGRVMYHYCDIVSPLEDVGFQVLALNFRYTRKWGSEKEEHFMRRLVKAKEETQAKAEDEYSAVAEMYERIG